MVGRPAARLVALLGLSACLAGGGCRSGAATGTPQRPPEAPPRRATGPRLPPPFGGRDPATLGLARVEGLLWLDAKDVAAWPPGGRGVRPAPGAGPGQGLSLRTDHVMVHTDLDAERALPVARAAQAHVEALVARYGDLLDLRLPATPIEAVVYARRGDFEAALARHLGHAPGYHAFYDADLARVLVAAEPRPAAPLPLLADLRHELTHAVLDRAAPQPVAHSRLAAGRHLWLWEGVALDAEDLGGGFAPSAFEARLMRLAARRRANGLVALDDLMRLPQSAFEGRHYDQTAVFFRFLATEPALQSRVLGLLRALLAGDLAQHAPEHPFGEPTAQVELRFVTWLDQRAGSR
jgi:hypothetical protein